MPKYESKFSVAAVKRYLQVKKASITEDINVISYTTKPRGGENEIDPRVVAYIDPSSHIAEQYRSIRTNIISLSPDNPICSFCVTSSLRGEGKTITAANLAATFARDLEKKTILIDADMRKPNIHKVFNLSRGPGLSEILNGKVEVSSLLDRAMISNLSIITAGSLPKNPTELLSSSRMENLLKQLREQFEWILFDISPILAVTDPGVLGKRLDGTLLVVRAGKTQAVDVERAYSLLLEANANPLGSIMTGLVTYIPYYLYRYRYIYSQSYYGT